MKAHGIDRFVYFCESAGTIYLMNLLSKHAKPIGAVAFSKSTSYYERLSVWRMRASLDEERKRFINGR
jgi:hypothetical protein